MALFCTPSLTFRRYQTTTVAEFSKSEAANPGWERDSPIVGIIANDRAHARAGLVHAAPAPRNAGPDATQSALRCRHQPIRRLRLATPSTSPSTIQRIVSAMALGVMQDGPLTSSTPRPKRHRRCGSMSARNPDSRNSCVWQRQSLNSYRETTPIGLSRGSTLCRTSLR